MTLLKMLRFILLLHALSTGLVLFPEIVRACGYPRMMSLRRKQGLVVDSAPRSDGDAQQQEAAPLFFFRSSTGFLKPITCGERTLPT
jgi:hypothetical protein